MSASSASLLLSLAGNRQTEATSELSRYAKMRGMVSLREADLGAESLSLMHLSYSRILHLSIAQVERRGGMRRGWQYRHSRQTDSAQFNSFPLAPPNYWPDEGVSKGVASHGKMGKTVDIESLPLGDRHTKIVSWSLSANIKSVSIQRCRVQRCTV